MVDKKWFSPPEFEKLAGKTRSKNWKLSIKCANTSLQKLIKVCVELCRVFSVHGLSLSAELMRSGSITFHKIIK